MSQISKNALKVENNQSFPNNNTGYITPALLREFNVDMIDSTVNQSTYDTASAGWDNSISALNTFTASQQPSFNALNAFTASQSTINTGVNAFTQSISASVAVVSGEVDGLQTWSSSINEIRDGGILQGYSTRFYFAGLVSASIVQNVNGPIAAINIEQDGTKLNTASFDAYETVINTYTASTNIRLNDIENWSGSAKISITALNAFTASSSPVVTGSLVTTSSFSGTTLTFTKGNGTTYTNVGIQNTASFNSYTASVNVTTASLNTFSASQLTKDATLATYTGSNDTKWTTLGAYTGSVNITTASLNTFTASATIRLNNLETFSSSQLTKDATLATYTGSNDTKWTTLGLLTGSYATTGSNSFNGNQTITGSLILSSSAAVELNVIGNAVITGSVQGNVVSMSIASSTASMDCNLGNFFTLTLANNATTHIKPTNIKTGQTINLLVTQGTAGTASFSNEVKFPTGSAYTASMGSGQKDIITFVTFADTTSIFAAAVKTLV